MVGSLRFLYLHQESFEFWRVGVGINCSGAQEVGAADIGSGLVFLSFRIFPDATIAPMDGNADGINLLAIDRECLDALGHHGFRIINSACAGDLELVPSADAPVLCHLFG